MSTGGNGTAPGSGGRPTFDQILFKGLGSDPAKMTSWTAMGAAAVGLIVGKILMDTGRYFDYFGRTDKAWARVGVALGSLSSVAQLIIACVQTWELIKHAFTDFHTINALDNYLGSTSDLMGAVLHLSAATYFTWRAYKMSGRKWWLGAFLMLFNVGALVMGSLVAIKGFTAPHVTIETAIKLKDFNMAMTPFRTARGALSLTSDGLVCATMMYYLFRSRTSIFHREKKIYHKLNALIIETMLPPFICILILGIHTTNKTSPTADWRKVLRMSLPCLYYVSLLHSLVSRHTIHRMLGDRLASEAIHHVSALSAGAGAGGGGRSHGSVFVATYRGMADGLDKEEASTDHINAIPLEKVDAHSNMRSGSPVSTASIGQVHNRPF